MGSFGVDIDLRFDQASALKAYADFTAKAKAMMKDVEAGVAGASQKLQKVTEDFARQMISTSTRAGRAVESSIRSLERQAELAGKTRSEQLLIRQEKWIKALGQDEAAIKRVTAAMQKLIQVEQEEERKHQGGHGSTGNLLLRGARDIFEGRTAYGAMDIGRAAIGMAGGGAGAAAGGGGMLAGIPTATLAIGGITVALGAATYAGYKAAESMGEYAEQVHRAQILTGMTAREVQQLDYAAKVTGTDASMLSRMMRGLTTAVEDTGSQGDKARAALQGMGVDLYRLQSGQMGVMELFQTISKSLKDQPDLWLKNKEAIDLLKRSGLEALPMLTDLQKSLDETKGMPFVSQATIDKFEEVNRQLKLLGAQWQQFMLGVKADLAEPFILTVQIVRAGTMILNAPSVGARQELGQYLTTPPPPPMPGMPFPTGDLTPEAMIKRGREQYFASQRNTLESLQREEQRTKQEYEALISPGNLTATPWAMTAAQQASEAAHRRADAARQAESDQKAIQEALRRAGLMQGQREENQYMLPGEAGLNRDLRMRGLQPKQEAEFRRLYAGQIDFEKTQQANKFRTQMLETQEGITREKFRATLGGVQAVDIRELGQGGATRADVEGGITKQYEQRLDIAHQTRTMEEELINKREINAKDAVGLAQQQRDLVAAGGKEEVAQVEAAMAKKKEEYDLDKRAQEQAREHAETMSKIQLADREESIKHGADLARKQADLRFKGDNPAASIAEEYRIAVTESQQLYDLEIERIKLHETGYKAEEDAAIALHKLHREDEQASEDAQYKLAKMQQDQLDNLKKTVEPLYHTLFTDPKKFPQQLRQTVTEAALHPIVSGLSEMTATALHPFIYGANGTGGLAGMFGNMFGGGRLNDVKLINGAVPVHVVGVSPGGPGGGGGVTSVYTAGGGYQGGGGTMSMGQMFNLPTYDRGAQNLMMSMGAALGGGGTATGGGFSSSGAPMSMDQMLNLPTRDRVSENVLMSMGAALGGGNSKKGLDFLGKYIGGSPAGKGGLGTIGSNFGGYLAALGSDSNAASRLKVLSTGPLANTPAGPAAGAAGMMLASAGIFGNQRGTWGGVAEATSGGFLAAGPIGAAVGAGIGLGEMVAGVESPRNEAKRLVRSVYHISINNTTADQIVATANRSYAGRVSLAVNSPEVRHMLGLYAAGTGQNNLFKQSANDPHGASLVESGGMLQQQATYQYGQAFTQSSNLPVYGGVSSTTLGAPGGGISLSLNVGGQDAAKFMTGQVVTPDVIQTQYAAAMNNSNGRVGQALMMSEPGSIAS